MGKNKLARFEENRKLPNVIQPSRADALGDFALKGKWRESVFNNNNPIVLELGCGKGEYSVGMAKAFPDKNFIGVDIKGSRFWRGAKTCLDEGIENAGFLRTQIEIIDHLFAENEVSEIWITFPDPQIKYRRTKHRLTDPEFLRRYNTILKPEGTVNLKTDSEFLHGYTHGVIHIEGHEVIRSTHDVYHPDHSDIPAIVTEVQTYYESKFLEEGKKITYIKFQLKY